MVRTRSTSTRSRSKKKEIVEQNNNVVGSTMEQPEKEEMKGADVVYLRVSLRSPIRFDDIPDGKGGTKSIRLPALDDDLRGQRDGILTPDGNALFVQMSRSDWEALQAMYGDARMFHSYNGYPACVAEISSITDARKGAYRDEISAVKTGLAPIDPKSEGVVETSTHED